MNDDRLDAHLDRRLGHVQPVLSAGFAHRVTLRIAGIRSRTSPVAVALPAGVALGALALALGFLQILVGTGYIVMPELGWLSQIRHWLPAALPALVAAAGLVAIDSFLSGKHVDR